MSVVRGPRITLGLLPGHSAYRVSVSTATVARAVVKTAEAEVAPPSVDGGSRHFERESMVPKLATYVLYGGGVDIHVETNK